MNRINSLKKKILSIKPYVILACTILLMSEIVSAVCLHELYSGFIFAVFQLIGIFLPGTALLLAWGWEKRMDWRACGISFVVGYCFTLFEYFAVMLSGIKDYTTSIVILVAVISGIYIIWKRKGQVFTNSDEGKYDQRLILILTGCMFLAAFLLGCCCNLVPPIVEEGQPTNDLTHWCGNIIELTRELPPRNFFYYTLDFKYHWFSSAQLAFVNLFTDIRPLYLGYYFSAVQSVLLRVFGFYLLLNKCTDNIKLQSLGAVMLFFSSGYDKKIFVTYLAHSYHASFGLEYGLAIFLVYVVLLINKCEEKRNVLRTSFLLWGCIFVLAGEKVSYAIVGLSGLGILSIGWLLKKSIKKLCLLVCLR